MRFPHWDYFLALDRDLDVVSRFIDFSDDNLHVYSTELTRLYLAIGSEIDVVGKQLILRCDPTNEARNIDHYRAAIPVYYPHFCAFPVTVPRLEATIIPWESWPADNPTWWKSYNNVKHRRHDHFREASLENVIHAMCALFALLFYFYSDEFHEGRIIPFPLSISVSREIGGCLTWGYDYHAPDFPQKKDPSDAIRPRSIT